MGNGAGVGTAGDEPGDVGHVGEEDGVYLFGDGGHAGEVDGTGISRASGDDQFGAVGVGQLGHLFVVDLAGVGVDAVGDDVEPFAGEVGVGAVGEVATGREGHAEDGVARFEEGDEDGEVGLGAGVGLDVSVGGTEELAGAVYGQLLDFIDDVGAAVEPFAGVPFDRFVGDVAAEGVHDRLADDVFGGDQFDLVDLPFRFAVKNIGDKGICFG